MTDKKKIEKNLKLTWAGKFMTELKKVKDKTIDILEEQVGE
jgi:hypothetical protein